MTNNDQNTNLAELKKLCQQFSDQRNWEQYHNPKDLAMALSIEGGELSELFLWQDNEQIAQRLNQDAEFRQQVADELADVLIYCLQMAIRVDFDITSIIAAKMGKNALKYPVEKAKDSAKKYDEL